jgi:hypothetical protein
MYVDWPEPVCSYRVGNLALAAATPIFTGCLISKLGRADVAAVT